MPARIKNLTFDTNMAIGMEIIPVDEKYVSNSHNLLTPHRASFHCILWFYEGTPVHEVDFVPVKIKPGNFLFVGKDRVQFFDQARPFRAKVLLFTDAFFGKAAVDTRFLNRTPLFNTFDSNKQCLLQASAALQEHWILMEKEDKAPNDRYKSLLLKNHLENFLLQAEREAGKNADRETGTDNQEEIFFSFKELMEENFREQQPVAFYTEKLRLSGKVLARVTEKLAGKTPKQMLDERLLLEAKRLLIHDSDAGKTIGYTLGFTEPTNFIKFFRRHTDTTPSAFRDRHRASLGQ